jgi:hypothetical protein
VLLWEIVNFDFGTKPIDQPFTDEELKSISGRSDNKTSPQSPGL